VNKGIYKLDRCSVKLGWEREEEEEELAAKTSHRKSQDLCICI
jgi:hypothetical protein